MHIAFINPQGNFDPADSYWTEHPDFGGQLVYVKETAVAMAKLGHRVDILTRRIDDPDWPEFSAELDSYPGTGVRIIRIPCGPDRFLAKEALWPYLGTDWVRNILAWYAAEGGLPDCFTTHYGDGGLVGALLAERTGIPFTLTGHSLGAQKMDKLNTTRESIAALDTRYNFRYRIFAERAAMAFAGRIITSTIQERVEQYGHTAYRHAVNPGDDTKFAVIPPGVNLERFTTDPSDVDARIEQRIDAAIARDLPTERRGLPIVILASRLDEKKNHLGVVEAFGRNPALRASANLAVVVRGLENPFEEFEKLNPGEAAIFRQIVATMEADGLHGAVTAFPLNSQEELAAAYRVLSGRQSAFCLTALYEPFGLAPLEAMSCGLPAVVTRNGGPSESLVEDGREFGVLVDPADPSDIARGLLSVVSDAGRWHALQKAGLYRVESKYTWARTAEGYEKTIRSLVENSSTPPSPSEEIQRVFTDPAAVLELSDLIDVYFAEIDHESAV